MSTAERAFYVAILQCCLTTASRTLRASLGHLGRSNPCCFCQRKHSTSRGGVRQKNLSIAPDPLMCSATVSEALEPRLLRPKVASRTQQTISRASPARHCTMKKKRDNVYSLQAHREGSQQLSCKRGKSRRPQGKTEGTAFGKSHVEKLQRPTNTHPHH